MTYQNPVYDANFPDPFVLKHCGEYWAYCTGVWRDGRCFGVLRSADLATWAEVGGALEPLPEGFPCYWAPEVVYDNGWFYLYYSAGDELNDMHLRVAVSDNPAGPFADSGRRLTREPFAIDPHIFLDDDGSRHLFYATDYLEHTHVGTGTARDRLPDLLTPAGQPRPVTRAGYDWQVYDPQRKEKGGVRWHTIEGPFVLKRKGRYYQMFSGGNWQNVSYGVSYATSERIDTPGEWAQHADGVKVLPILRTVPGQVVGPGHNSVVRGPDNRQLFCVYHRWNLGSGARVMAIDPLDWAGERMLLLGPTTVPQPLPRPTIAARFERDVGEGLGPEWLCAGGRWSARGGAAVQSSTQGESSAAPVADPASYAAFLAEVSVRLLDDPSGRGAYGVGIGDELRVVLEPGRGIVALSVLRPDGGWSSREVPLPAKFDAGAYHLLRVELNAGRVTARLDEGIPPLDARLPGAGGAIELRTHDAAAAFAGFALTTGWEDLFDGGETSPGHLGWVGHERRPAWQIAEGQLVGAEDAGPILKGPLPASYELVVNARPAAHGGGYGIYPAARPGALGPLVAMLWRGGAWSLVCRGPGGERALALPEGFDTQEHQQLRFRVSGGRIAAVWERQSLAELDAPAPGSHVALAGYGDGAAFDMVRVTATTR